jgi:hypothetical protein
MSCRVQRKWFSTHTSRPNQRRWLPTGNTAQALGHINVVTVIYGIFPAAHPPTTSLLTSGARDPLASWLSRIFCFTVRSRRTAVRFLYVPQQKIQASSSGECANSGILEYNELLHHYLYSLCQWTSTYWFCT